MKVLYSLVILLVLLKYIRCDCTLDTCPAISVTPSQDVHKLQMAENRMAKQIIALLDHYKQSDPLGVPDSIASVPDPFPVPPIKKSVGMGTLHMREAQAYGFSKFRIKSVDFDVNQLLAKCVIELDAMSIIGNYTLRSFLSSASGPFNVTLTNVVAKGNASIAVERDGKIRTQEISMDMNFSDMSMNFENLGFLGSIFQSIVNGAPNMVFDSMKPFMLKEAGTKIREEVDSRIKGFLGDYTLPNSISPLDMAIGEARRRVREKHYDPFIVPNYNHSVSFFNIQLLNTWINGVSSFYRVGDLVVNMDNNTITIGLHLGTQEITGSTDWEITAGKGIITRTGYVTFSLQYIQAMVVLSQSLDTRNHPQIKDIQFELGNIQIRSDGAGTLDYVVEFLINVIPNLLRYQIMDALENPIKTRIQDEMNKINVEKLIVENIPAMEKLKTTSTISMSDFKF